MLLTRPISASLRHLHRASAKTRRTLAAVIHFNSIFLIGLFFPLLFIQSSLYFSCGSFFISCFRISTPVYFLLLLVGLITWQREASFSSSRGDGVFVAKRPAFFLPWQHLVPGAIGVAAQLSGCDNKLNHEADGHLHWPCPRAWGGLRGVFPFSCAFVRFA